MTLQFLGAAQTVTESMHHFSVNGKHLLLDCGLFHGRREEARRRNSEFPFDAPASPKQGIRLHVGRSL